MEDALDRLPVHAIVGVTKSYGATRVRVFGSEKQILSEAKDLVAA